MSYCCTSKQASRARRLLAASEEQLDNRHTLLCSVNMLYAETANDQCTISEKGSYGLAPLDQPPDTSFELRIEPGIQDKPLGHL